MWKTMIFILPLMAEVALAAEARKPATALLGRYNRAQSIVFAELVSQEDKVKVPMFMGSHSMFPQKWKVIKIWKAGPYKVGDIISGYSGVRAKDGEKSAISTGPLGNRPKEGIEANALRISISGDEEVASRFIGFLDHISKAKNEEERVDMARKYAAKKVKEIEKRCGERARARKQPTCLGEIAYWE